MDTPDYIADRVFQDCGINVKRLNEKRTTDSRFLYIGCRISGRDIKRFREAIEELERRFLLTGYRDYRTKVLSLLMQLVENEKKPETTTSAGSKEYPKSVLIPFIPQDSLDDILMAFYSLSNTKTYLPEVNILSKNPPRDKNGYIIVQDIFSLVLRKNTPITYRTFRRIYLQNRNGITAVVALDPEDKHRIGIQLMAEEEYKQAGIEVNPIVTFYDRETEARLVEFFKNWDGEYQKLKGIHSSL